MLVLYPIIFHCILLHPSDAQSFRCSTPNFSKKHYCFTLSYYRFLLYTQHLLWFLRLALPIPQDHRPQDWTSHWLHPGACEQDVQSVWNSAILSAGRPLRRLFEILIWVEQRPKTKGSFLDGPWWLRSNSSNIIWPIMCHSPFSEKGRFYGFLGHGGPQGFIPVNRGNHWSPRWRKPRCCRWLLESHLVRSGEATHGQLPPGKHRKNHGKSPFWMGQSTRKWPFSIAFCMFTRG